MSKLLERPVIVILLLLVLSGYIYFFQLEKIALTDPDETFYAQTGKEMLKRGEWMTPYLYNKPQFEKPIFFYWLLVPSYKIFGVNEFAARFPSALFAFLGVVAVYLLGRLIFNNRTGIFSAIALATNLEYLVLANACVTDMVLSTFMLGGVLFFFYAQVRKKDYFYILSAASFAFAVLTKGPIFIVLPGFIILTYLAVTKNFAVFKNFKAILWSAAAFLLIALPWYIIMYKVHANIFMDEFFGFHNITRFLTPEHRTGSQFYYNIPILLGGFFPWSAFLPLGLWHFFKKVFSSKHERRNERNYMLFILLWLAIIFTFFTISSTKLPTYIFPCFISLALIVGKLWDDFLNQHRDKSFLRGMIMSYYFLLTAIAISLVAGYIFIKMDYPDMIPGFLIAGVFLMLGMVLSLIAFVLKRFLAVFLLITYSIALMLYPVTKLALPSLEGYETGRPVSKVIMSYFKEGDIIGCAKDFRPGVAFYTGIIPVFIENNEGLLNLLQSGRRVWVVIKEKNLVGDTKTVYKWGEKCLATNSGRMKR